MEIYSFLWLWQVAVLKEELLGDKGYEDIHCQVCLFEFKVNIDINVSYCQEKDLDCLELLCPIGWQWNSQMEECSLKRGTSKNVLHMIRMLILVTYFLLGFSCCPERFHICGSLSHQWCRASNSTSNIPEQLPASSPFCCSAVSSITFTFKKIPSWNFHFLLH